MQAKKTLKNDKNISVEDYLIYLNKAIKQNNIDAIDKLHKQFPEISDLVFNCDYIDKLSDPADCEQCYPHPIVIASNRLTEKRILDLIIYLLGNHGKSPEYNKYLWNHIPYHEVFNYFFEYYQRDYEPKALWDNFFLKYPELRHAIELRHIETLDELIYRASDYFEKWGYVYKQP